MSALEQIKKAIKDSAKNKEKIAQLNLSGIKIGKFTPQITTAIEECKGLEILILSECGLESLNGLPKLSIEGIDLSNNELTDNDITLLKIYPRLSQLLLSENKIQKVQSLKGLSACKDLAQLDISGNPVADDKDYRKTVFDTLKELNSLDGKDADGNQIEEQQDFEDDGDDDQDEFSGEDDQDDEEYQEQSESEKPKKKRGGK